jgi:hypothetical protein
MRVEVSVDSEILFSTDISAPSEWQRVNFDLAEDSNGAALTVSVIALDGIEQGWLWGRSSTVLVREVVVEEP